MKKEKSINRIKDSYPVGMTVYCWKFCHPKFGWCGGSSTDDWSTHQGEMKSRMQFCEWPSKLITEVVG
jgi:hypothetical protein